MLRGWRTFESLVVSIVIVILSYGDFRRFVVLLAVGLVALLVADAIRDYHEEKHKR